MKDQHHENSHPVDQYFLQQSELLEIQYNPKHWQQLSDQLADQTIADSTSDNTEDDIPKAAPMRTFWLLLGMLLLFSSTILLWQLYAAKATEDVQHLEKTSIYPNSSTESSTDLIIQSTELEPEGHSIELVDLQAKPSTNMESVQRARNRVVQPIETSTLPLELKSVSTQTRPLVVPLDKQGGEKKEVFIFW
ncbi:MAG: hypothetical protein AAFO03_00005 [Bacteroidota bacterium]